MKTVTKKFLSSKLNPLFAFFSISFLLVLLYVGHLPHPNTAFFNEKCKILDKNWTYISPTHQYHTVSLPIYLKPNMVNGIRVSKKLPSRLDPADNCIAQFCIFRECRFYIDGVLFYDSRDYRTSLRHYDKARGPFWAITALPDNSSGKILTMELTSPYKEYNGNPRILLLGSKGAIINQIVQFNLSRLITSFLSLFFGVIFIIISLIQYRHLPSRNSLLFLGWFLFWLGSWIFSESNMTSLVFTSDTLSNTLSFISLRMMFLSFLEYLYCCENLHFRKTIRIATYVLYGEAFLATLLQLLQIRDFYQNIPIHMTLLICMLLFLLCELLAEVFYYKNKSLHYLLYCFAIMEVAALFDIITFLFITKGKLGTFYITSCIIAVTIIGIKEILHARQTVRLAQEASYYEKLATTDIMTGCHNRVLMLQELSYLNQQGVLSASTAALMCDINGLKTINDQYGHKYGDSAIQLCASLLMTVFSSHGSVYRTGGDEFTCLLTHTDSQEIDRLITEFLAICKKKQQDVSFPFSVSIGYAFYDKEIDRNAEAIIHRADQSMYRMKQQMKLNRQEGNVYETTD